VHPNEALARREIEAINADDFEALAGVGGGLRHWSKVSLSP
jgi:hypothetical protein